MSLDGVLGLVDWGAFIVYLHTLASIASDPSRPGALWRTVLAGLMGLLCLLLATGHI